MTYSIAWLNLCIQQPGRLQIRKRDGRWYIHGLPIRDRYSLASADTYAEIPTAASKILRDGPTLIRSGLPVWHKQLEIVRTS